MEPIELYDRTCLMEDEASPGKFLYLVSDVFLDSMAISGTD